MSMESMIRLGKSICLRNINSSKYEKKEVPNNRFHHDNPACHDSCGLIYDRKNHARLGLQVKRMLG